MGTNILHFWVSPQILLVGLAISENFETLLMYNWLIFKILHIREILAFVMQWSPCHSWKMLRATVKVPLINFQHPKHKSHIYIYYNRTVFNLADKAVETSILSFLEYELPSDINISEDIRYRSHSKFSEKFEKNSRCTTN